MNDLTKLITELNDQACEKNLKYFSEVGPPWDISTDGEEIVIKFYGFLMWSTSSSVTYGYPDKEDLLISARKFVNCIGDIIGVV